MKTKVTIIILLSICISNFIIGQTTKNLNTSKLVKIKYVDDVNKGKGISNYVIFFNYYDKTTSNWKTIKTKTNKIGFAEFNIPLNIKGDSYAFYYSTSAEENNDKMTKANNGNIYLFKIPSDTTIKYLEIWIDKNKMVSNKVGSIQITTK